MIRSLTIAAIFLAAPATAQVPQGPKNVPEFEPAFENQTRAPELTDGPRLRVRTVADGLNHPWGIAVLPDGSYLVTERVGALNHVDASGRVRPISGLPEIAVFGQGGLLDVAVAEDFASSRRIFLTYSKPVGGRSAATAAATAILSEDYRQLSDVTDIFVQTDGSRRLNHFGSRILIDGDIAYITTGDRRTEDKVQSLRSTVGKVIRVRTDGTVPEDNPFAGQNAARPEIYALGIRNAQGADLHPATGELWTLEHGPAGGDELNRIRPGGNYGWPIVSYGENYDGSPVGRGIARAEEMIEPVYYWDPVIAPGDFTFYDGNLFEGWSGDVIAAALRGGLVRLKLDGDRVSGEARYLDRIGRVRDVEVDWDGSLLVLTDDPEGEILRVTPD